MAHRLHGHPTAGGAQFGDPLEQQILSLGGQIHQQPLGQPCGGAGGVESGGDQRGRPVVAQVHRNLTSIHDRLRSVLGKCRRLVLQHLGLVDLVDHGAVRPRQSVGARVQTRGEDDHLTDARIRGVGEERVEEVRPHRLVAEHVGEHRRHLGIGLGDAVLQGIVEEVLPHSGAGPGHQDAREGVTDQWVRRGGLPGARRGHHHRRRSDARRDVPGVIIAAQAAHGFPIVAMLSGHPEA